MQDTEASPTYVPLPQMSAHAAVPVMAGDSAANIVMRSKKKSARWLSFDNLIEDAKYPLLLSWLYFVFQMPQARALMRRVFSFGYNEDCTANTIGYVMQSLLCALCAFMLATVQEEVAGMAPILTGLDTLMTEMRQTQEDTRDTRSKGQRSP